MRTLKGIVGMKNMFCCSLKLYKQDVKTEFKPINT